MENETINPLLDTMEPSVLEPDLPKEVEQDPMAHILASNGGDAGAMMAFPDYQLKVHPKAMEIPEVKAIVDSGVKVADMTQEQLRVMYHFISGSPLKRVYSASAVSHINKTGRFPEYDDMPEGDSLFIGDQVHKAMEVRGENLKVLKTYADIGTAPEKPEMNDLTPDNIKILTELALGTHYVMAYCKVKSNKTIDDVSEIELEEYLVKPALDTSGMSDEDKEAAIEADKPSKPIQKLVNAAEKEALKVKSHIVAFRKYQQACSVYEEKKKDLCQNGNIVLDDLSFRKMSAQKMYDTIIYTYKALKEDDEVMNYYWNGYKEGVPDGVKMESLTEFVVLWKYFLTPKTYVPCKSMFDKLHLDFTNKMAIIQDIKTHSKRGRQFVTTNYFEYSYFRSMAFYTAAVKAYLIQRGEDPEEWKFYSILLPVSTITQEVGCFNPTVVISAEDIQMGTEGGYMKPIGTKFNKTGEAQWALGAEQFSKLEDLGIIHPNAYEYYIKGWKQLIQSNESTSKIPVHV